MILYLTSSPVGSYKAKGAPAYKGLNPENDLVKNLTADWKDKARCLLSALIRMPACQITRCGSFLKRR